MNIALIIVISTYYERNWQTFTSSKPLLHGATSFSLSDVDWIDCNCSAAINTLLTALKTIAILIDKNTL